MVHSIRLIYLRHDSLPEETWDLSHEFDAMLRMFLRGKINIACTSMIREAMTTHHSIIIVFDDQKPEHKSLLTKFKNLNKGVRLQVFSFPSLREVDF